MENKIKTIAATLIGTVKKRTHLLDLSETTIVITGSSKGIGKAMADLFYEKGANLVLISRSIDKQTFKDWDKSRILVLNADLTKENDVLKVRDSIMKKFERVDVLINNVGMFIGKALDDTTTADFDAITQTNLKSMFLVTKVLLPIFKKRKSGYIVNIGSKISHNTNVAPNKVLYAMTKYAVEGFSCALNKELKQFSVRVSCLMPGTVNTFTSLNASQYMDPKEVALVILQLIKLKNIDFESVVFKSVNQDI